MVSYAIVQASGKQFWVEEKRFYDLDKLPLNKGEVFKLNNILLINKNNSPNWYTLLRQKLCY
jgi:large subunit ribosomal protein L21